MKRSLKFCLTYLLVCFAVVACGGGGSATATPNKLTIVGSGS